MNLVQEMVESDQDRLAEAKIEYVRLLKENKSSPQAMSRMREVMRILNKNAATVAEDLKIVERASELRAIVDDKQANHEEIAQTNLDLKRAKSLMEEKIKQAKKEHWDIYVRSLKLSDKYRAISDASLELKSIARKHPELVDPE